MSNAFQIKGNKLYIAKSKNPLKVKWTRVLKGEVSSISISKDCANRYFVSFCAQGEIAIKPTISKTIGIDLGLTDFVIISDGLKIKPIKSLAKQQKKLVKLQRSLSKKTKGSNNSCAGIALQFIVKFKFKL
ncbi:putative transposase [Candidatus Hepatincolaceae symbiont of Richtersius coronifer]